MTACVYSASSEEAETGGCLRITGQLGYPLGKL